MRLIRVTIDNFGKLSHFSYDFSDGFQVLCEKNGWGKSTLAAFLRVMFFGFAGEKKRDDLSNERKRYEPWQKGTYGGSIIFETQGIVYEMSRVFGKKESEDDFCLLRHDTNLKCDDFSANIGEELFRIDREAFCRTVYIEQQDCETYATDAINAKLGNLIDYTDDVNNYESAYARLKDKANHMRPHHKKGYLKQLQEKIAEMENAILQEENIEASINEDSHLLEEQQEKKRQIEKFLNELEKKQQRVLTRKDENESRIISKLTFSLVAMGSVVFVLGCVVASIWMLLGMLIVLSGGACLLVGLLMRDRKHNRQSEQYEDLVTVEQIMAQMQRAKNEWELTQQQIYLYGQRLEKAREEWQNMQSIKEELMRLREEYQEGIHEYTLVCKTMELLQLAKERLTTKYMGPVQRGFNEYYQIFNRVQVDNFQFDADMNLTIHEQGMRRSTKFLSEGCRDLAGICTRLAMTDAMYQDEKPFLIFDDPFVNLDEEKIEVAKQLLKKVSERYQVIYLTCHKSRAF